MTNKILGIWDGHDSGAALIEGDKILYAVNEERLTRRKLEIAFPTKSIKICLDQTGTSYQDISNISLSTWDFAKTLTRVFPSLKEQYYLIRRRKAAAGRFASFKKKAKYKLTEFPPTLLSHWVSRRMISRRLKKLGFNGFNLYIEDHHFCHAATAAFCSPFEQALVLTLDGLGDALSGSIYQFCDGVLDQVSAIPARHSFGIFFEHVTNLMNMRELEDEGKVMALANYAFPIDDNENPMMELIEVNDLTFRCRFSALKMFDELHKILWRYPSEQFAFMAQRTLEVKTLELVKNAVKATGLTNLCLAGGIFSNVKLNRIIRIQSGIKKCFVFPHMGDGGLAIGAAMASNYRLNAIHRYSVANIFWGPEYADNDIETALHTSGLSYSKCADIAKDVAEKLANGKIIFWFQGRMEYGPRALGARSILARPDSEAIKDELNVRLKRRVWYQPFCPAMLESDANDILEDYDGNPEKFMTMAYKVKKEKRALVRGVINVDGSCRPQIVEKNDSIFFRLIEEIKGLTGHGILLNTSFNLHGEPLVCSPEDAIKTMADTGCDFLAIGNFLVMRQNGI
ncbi:MAG: hypothetical protein JRF56_05885 [Deltaproteobacteria bacterium]|jgi:carbamoyltransferase|nr:hypothetical protein [Deltaproteobacteria bacterium]